jgi:hypothetical protein
MLVFLQFLRRIASGTSGFGHLTLIMWYLLAGSVHSFSSPAVGDVKPDPYNAKNCRTYFENLKPGMRPGKGDDPWLPAEQKTYQELCEANPVDLSSEKDNKIRPSFLKALIESNQFDAPGYDRISIKGALITDDLDLSKLDINNTLELTDFEFRGNVDFSYSSSSHNIYISGNIPDYAILCFSGFQTTKSVFLYKFNSNKKQGASNSMSTATAQQFCDGAVSPGVYFEGARVAGELNIWNVNINQFEAVGAQFGGQVDVRDSEFETGINFSTASAGEFVLRGVKITGSCDNSAVSLDGAAILGYAQFIRSEFDCGISMTGAHVSKDVELLGSTLGYFDFRGSTADGDLQIGPSPKVVGACARVPVWLPRMDEKGNRLPNLELSHSSVALVRVALNNWPNMGAVGGLKPQKDGCVNGDEFSIGLCPDYPSEKDRPKPLKPAGIVGGTLQALGALSELFVGYDVFESLSGARTSDTPTTIVADFRFKAFAKPTFCAFEKYHALNSQDTASTSVRTKPLKLLDYISDDKTINEVEVERWLASTQYSPSEYQLMYDLLTAEGENSEAKRIAYVGKLIETRSDAWPAFFMLTLNRWIIGYGYCSYLAVFWAVCIWLFGAMVFTTLTPNTIRIDEGAIIAETHSKLHGYFLGNFRVNKKTLDYGLINPLGYSFDILLPVVRLRELHYQLDLGGWQRFWFYFQKIAGWVLGIFVLASLSGLTK